jgi:ABC-type lipoprotein release transport system permease subunit
MLAAIIMGVWAMIFMNALMRGMTDQMVSNGLNTLPGQAQLQHPDYRRDPSVVNSIAKPSEQLASWLKAEPHILAWTTRVRVLAVIASARETRGVLLIGVDPAGELAMGADPKDAIEGRLLQSPDDRGVVIGRRLAQRLETDLGKRIVLSSQDPNNELLERGAQIVGIYTARLEASEEAYVYTERSPC